MTTSDQLDGRPIHVTEVGDGPRVVFVHGAMTSGRRAWAQQAPLADRWRLVVPDRRGFGPNPPAGCSDFEVDVEDVAPLLGDGAHLVGHSYGGLVALLLAARRPELVHTLTLIEPAAHALALDDPAVRESVVRHERLGALSDPEDFLDGLLAFLGLSSTDRRRPMGARTAQHVHLAMCERPPWSADIPAPRLADHPYPVLVMSGGRGDVFEVMADAAAAAYGATGTAVAHQHRTLPGAGHDVPSMGGPVNDLLENFWRDSTAEPGSAPPRPGGPDTRPGDGPGTRTTR